MKHNSFNESRTQILFIDLNKSSGTIYFIPELGFLIFSSI